MPPPKHPLFGGGASIQNCCSDHQEMQTTEKDLLGTDTKGTVVSALGQIYQQASRHQAVVELSDAEDFQLRQLFETQGLVLSGGEPAVVAPIVPFHHGGSFSSTTWSYLKNPTPNGQPQRRGKDAQHGRMARSLTQPEDWTRDSGGCLTAWWQANSSRSFSGSNTPSRLTAQGWESYVDQSNRYICCLCAAPGSHS
jgi:hypothetical protein